MNKRTIFSTIAILSALAAVSGASASVSYLGAPLLETFDSLPSSGSTALNATPGTINAMPGTTGWVGTKVSGTGTTLNLVADAGGGNAGALYSYGAVGTGERAFGELASAGAICALGVEIVNNSGFTMTSFTVQYNREQWRSSTTSTNSLVFAYAVSGGSANATNFLTDAGVTGDALLDAVGEAPVATNGALDGNVHSILVTDTINVNVANGDSLFLRWTDTNDVGNDAGLALDNFGFSATVVPEPASIVGIATALLLLAARRRK